MRTAVLALALALLGAVGTGGCDEAESFSDKKVEEAAKVEDGSVGGDPFCEVAEVLNDAEEIEAVNGDGAAIITSAQGNVGLEVVTPFPEDCEETVREGLNELDPKSKE